MCIDTVNLRDRLCNIEADCRNRLHNLAPPNRGASTAPTFTALTRRWRSRPQHQAQTLDMAQRINVAGAKSRRSVRNRIS
jgi:hypothetical protein